MYPPNRRTEAVSLSFYDFPKDWHIASPIQFHTLLGPSEPVHQARVDSYDAATDGPIEVGTFTLFHIDGIEPPIDVAIHGDGWRQADVENTLRKICKYEIELMGGAPLGGFAISRQQLFDQCPPVYLETQEHCDE